MSPVMIRLGALAWGAAVQFFVVQVVVAMAWFTPYSLVDGYISDLGNTSCARDAVTATAAICSPRHALMNASFIAIGITMAIGGVLARRAFVDDSKATMAVALFCLAGVGVVLVGLYPENAPTSLHLAGAAVNFITGNAALVLFGTALPPVRRGLARFSVVAGVVGLVATALLAANQTLGIGVGTMERLAAYPMSTWQVVIGAALMRRPSAGR